MPNSDLPSAPAIQGVAEEVVQRPYFRLDPYDENAGTAVDFIAEALRWLMKPLVWLYDLPMPDWLRWTMASAKPPKLATGGAVVTNNVNERHWNCG